MSDTPASTTDNIGDYIFESEQILPTDVCRNRMIKKVAESVWSGGADESPNRRDGELGTHAEDKLSSATPSLSPATPSPGRIDGLLQYAREEGEQPHVDVSTETRTLKRRSHGSFV